MKGFEREKIWDPLTRLWHWLLAFGVCCAWWFGEYMAFDTVKWHFYAGYFVLGLVSFRLVRGFWGPAPIRFRSFIYSPSQIWQYLKQVGVRNPSGYPGHNPIGALSVFALLVSITFQAVTGLFIEADDFFESGPLAGYVSENTIRLLSGWHHLNAKILAVLVGLHLSAILFYLFWKKENLIKPMVVGWKWVKNEKVKQAGENR